MKVEARESRFAKQHDRVLKAAATCFNQKGYSGTSLKDVSRHLNLTDAALYYYVRNKEELVYLCYLRAARLARDAMEKAVTEGNTGLEQARLFRPGTGAPVYPLPRRNYGWFGRAACHNE